LIIDFLSRGEPSPTGSVEVQAARRKRVFSRFEVKGNGA